MLWSVVLSADTSPWVVSDPPILMVGFGYIFLEDFDDVEILDNDEPALYLEGGWSV